MYPKQNLLSTKQCSLNWSSKYCLVLFVQVRFFFYLILHNYPTSMLIVFLTVLTTHSQKEHPQQFPRPLFIFCPAFLLSVFCLSFLPSAIKCAGQASSWISTSVLTEGAVIFFVYNLLNFSDLRNAFWLNSPELAEVSTALVISVPNY